MEHEARRARRIRLTKKVASRRRSDYFREYDKESLGSIGSYWAVTSAHYWHKTSVGRCVCRKRHHGAPRRDKGMCDIGARKRIYQIRRRTRELNLLLVRRQADPYSDEVTLLDGQGLNNLR